MTKLIKYAFAIIGWLVAFGAIYWGYNRCSNKEKILQAEVDKVKTVKQNPVSTFMDESGREHVKYPDGTVATLPKNKAKQQLYAYLRDSVFTPDALIKSDAQVTAVTKISTRTTGHVSKSILDSLPKRKSIQVDPWLMLFPNDGGFDYALDEGINAARYTEKSGLFNLKRTPYISFSTDNPKGRITGYSKYDYPLPVVQPTVKIFGEADYDIKNQLPSTDLGLSVRLGKFEVIGYGRLYLPSVTTPPPKIMFDRSSIAPGYGVKLKYNFFQL